MLASTDAAAMSADVSNGTSADGITPDVPLTDVANSPDVSDGPTVGGIRGPGSGCGILLNGTTSFGRTGDMAASVAKLTKAAVELWFKSVIPTGEQMLFDLHGAGQDSRVALMLADAESQNFAPLTGRILVLFVDARDFGGTLNTRGFDVDSSLPTFKETEWHHYAVVLNGATQRAFIDGVELTTAQQRDGLATTTVATVFDGPGRQAVLDVGRFSRTTPARFLSGYVADIRLSKTDRYAGPFTPVYPSLFDPDTVSFWPVDEGAGATSEDLGDTSYSISWTMGGWLKCTSPKMQNGLLIGFGFVWKYLDYGDPGQIWRLPDFDDNTWKSGPARLGYNGTIETATVTNDNGGAPFPPLYLRQTFYVTDPLKWKTLRMELIVDDGAVIYLNGQEIGRDNVPPGELTNQSAAIDDHRGAAETEINSGWSGNIVSSKALVAGKNVLAVEVHNAKTSGDLGFDFQLRAVP